MKGKKQASILQETRISNFLGWKRISGSGARPCSPGDIKSYAWLGECKTHIEANHTIVFYFSIWDKIVEEAASSFRRPALFIDDGSQSLSATRVLFDITNDMVDKLDIQTLESYDSKPSIRYYVNKDIEPRFFRRNNRILCVMSVEEFKEYLELGE